MTEETLRKPETKRVPADPPTGPAPAGSRGARSAASRGRRPAAVALPSVFSMTLRRRLQPVYFRALPWANYAVNLWRRGRWDRRYMPRELMIETTNHCNAHCVMCPHDRMKRPRGHMDMRIFERVIGECRAFEGRGLCLTLHKDGEPLTDPDLFRRIRHIRERLPRSWVQFNTNAQLLDENRAARLLDDPPDRVVFSVDGASAESYSPIRKGLDYETVVAHIERFLQLRHARAARTRVVMQMVVSRDNVHEVPAYRARWAHRVDAVVLKPMHSFRVQGTSFHGPVRDTAQRTRCRQPFSVLVVFQSGDLGLCCWDTDRALPLGHVLDGDLRDLYNGAGFDRVRRAMIRKDCRGLPPCDGCSRIYGLDDPVWLDRWMSELRAAGAEPIPADDLGDPSP